MTLTAPLAKTSRRQAVPWVLGGAGVLLAGAVTTGLVAHVAQQRRLATCGIQIEMGDGRPGDADEYDDP